MKRRILIILVGLILFCFLSLTEVLAACNGSCYTGTCGDYGKCTGIGTCTGGKSCCMTCPPVATNTPPPAGCKKSGENCTSDSNCCSNLVCNSLGKCAPICSVCGRDTQVCVYQCQTCDGIRTNGYKFIQCWASQACKDQSASACFTWDNVEAPATQCPNLCEGVIPTPSSVPIAPSCQVYTCWDMGTVQCPYAFNSCPGGVGFCDNCGTDCGTCSGALPGSTPVPTIPACVQNCLDPVVSPCISTTCSDATCLGNCNQYCYGTLSCVQTTLNRFEIRRAGDWYYTDRDASNGRDITDAQNRLQICDSFLDNESPNPRSLIYVAWLNNANGCSDIDANSVKMRWLGNNTEIAMAKLASYQTGPCAYTATVTYPITTNVASAQGFQITMKSISGGVTTPWTTVTPDLKLKVWDCQVPVSGSFYNAGANDLTCTGTGVFTDPFTDLGVNSMMFKDVSPAATPNKSDVTAGVTGTSFSANLRWNHTYQPIFNGGPDPNQGLKVLNRLFRGYDMGNPVPVLTCPVADSFSQMDIVGGHEIVHPYWANPTMQLDMSFAQAMEPWFQVWGSGLRTGINLRSGVPATAINQALTMGDTAKDNGLVIYNTLLGNINGNNGNNTFGYPNNWKLSGKSYKDLLNNYNYFYNNLFLKKGIGTTGNSWSQRPTGGIFFVNGALNIDSDNTSSVNNPLLVIAKGDVNIESTVNQLNLLLMTDGNINIGGISNSQLLVNGSLYAKGDITISRDMGDIVYNTLNPAVRIDYQPTAIFSLDKEIYKVLSDWRSE